MNRLRLPRIPHVQHCILAKRDSELQRLKRDIEAGKVDVVICFKLDRITRSLKDFVELWELFADHEVDVISLREKFDTSTPTGEAMLQLLEFVLSNSLWANGELTPEFRQSFGMLADMATVGAQKMAAGLLTSSHHQEELPR